MESILNNLKAAVTPSKIKTESYVGPIFYQVTFGLCLASFLIVFGRSYFGEPMKCEGGPSDSHCFKNGTTRITDQELYTCRYQALDDENQRPSMKYYYWIPWILLLNGIVFHIPHRIWKMLEGGIIKQFYSEESNDIHLADENGAHENEDILQRNSQQFNEVKDSLKWYYTKYVLCQFLNVVILLAIFLINNAFFQNGFANYGSQYVHYSLFCGGEEQNEHHCYDPLCDTFPWKTSCDENRGSPGGEVTKLNGICELDHNMANQYIFLVMWFWYIFLFVIGGLQMIFEAVCVLVPAFRYTLLKWKLPPGSTVNLEQFSLEQWFLLFQIGRNMQQTFFYEFLQRVSDEKYEKIADDETIPMNPVANEQV